ncbi:MAG: hypothetical protein ACO36A_10150 [Ilumatobacteraceae bacterium]
MRGRLVRVVVALVLVATGAIVLREASGGPDLTRRTREPFPSGRWVTIKPPLGRVDRPIVEFLTNEEIGVTRGIQRMIDLISDRVHVPFEGYDIEWHIEPSVVQSPMYAMQNKVLGALDSVLGPESSFMRDWPIDIVVGRSQKWIQGVLRERGCTPNLSAWNGVILMAAAVCNRQFIVSNITGFLWIVNAQQRITPALEARREPLLSRVPYRLVSRGVTALAHEYVHIWRAAGSGGIVRPDEPAWYSEGIAEFWAGIGAVLANRDKLSYESQHVVRVRDFFDWPRSCTKPLSAYRVYSPLNNACEYHLGVMAIEYLYSRYSSLQTTLRAFSRAREFDTFEEGFAVVFGLSLQDFENEANRYIARIKRVELAQTRAISPR